MNAKEPLIQKKADSLRDLNKTDAERLLNYIQQNLLIYGIRIPDNQVLRSAVVEPVVRRDSQAVNEALEVLVMNATPEELEKLMPNVIDFLRELLNMADWHTPSQALLNFIKNWTELNAENQKNQLLEMIASLSAWSETPHLMTIEEVREAIISSRPDFVALIGAIGELLRTIANITSRRLMKPDDLEEVKTAFLSKTREMFDPDYHGGSETAHSLIMDAALAASSKKRQQAV